MTTNEIALRLVELCRIGDYQTAQKELYADNATSTEFSPQTQKLETAESLEAIIAKGQHFRSLMEEIHSSFVGEPIIAGAYFSVAAILDVTLKGMGRIKMEEIGVYHVKDGKVVSEQFFY
jgi:hypothetical protein